MIYHGRFVDIIICGTSSGKDSKIQIKAYSGEDRDMEYKSVTSLYKALKLGKVIADSDSSYDEVIECIEYSGFFE